MTQRRHAVVHAREHHGAIAAGPRSKPGPSFEGASSPDGIALLLDLVEQANEGFVSADVIGQLASRAECYLLNAERGMTLGAAFGVEDDLSSRQWYHDMQRTRWQAAVADLAATYYPRLSPRQASIRIAQQLGRYLCSRWPRDQQRGMPADYRGTIAEDLYALASLGERFGNSARSIERAIQAAQVADRA